MTRDEYIEALGGEYEAVEFEHEFLNSLVPELIEDKALQWACRKVLEDVELSEDEASVYYAALVEEHQAMAHEDEARRARECEDCCCATPAIETRGPYPFMGPVAQGDRQNRAAHGGVVYRQRCHCCKRVRSQAINGFHCEMGLWGFEAE